MRVATIERLVEAVGANLAMDVRFQGGLVDRLIDAEHASLVELVVGLLRRLGWLVELEFGFNVYGERGSVDVLAWHAMTRTLLIIEIKSRFTDLQAMLMSLARKLRLVPSVVREQRGWDPVAVARIVVASGTHGNRTVMDRHAAIFDAALPARARQIRTWLRTPSGPIAGVWLVSRDGMARGT